MVRLFIDDTSNTRLLKEIEIPAMGQSSTDNTFELTIPLNFKLESGYILKAATEYGDSFNVIAEGLDFDYYASSVRPESTNYTANTDSAAINTQNTNLDGSGTVATLVTAAAAASGYNGLAINSIYLKATTDIDPGMLRLYIQNTGTGSSNTFLFKEIPLVPTEPSGTFPSFSRVVRFPETLQIECEFKIVASIESTSGNAVIGTIDAMDWEYPS